MTRILHTAASTAIALVLAVLVSPRLGAQQLGETDALRVSLLRLQQENDSLRMEINRLKTSTGASYWDLLSGLEPDEDVPGYADGGFSSLSRKKGEHELMVEVWAACPSLGRIPYDPAIKRHVELYTETRRKTMSFALARYRAYLPQFKEIFSKYGVPEDVMALVIVESAVSPRAVSPVGASGMWQLMKATASNYGLRVDAQVDERFDPIPSCHAAAKYLKNAHERFGDWSLAIASYNCGPGNVRRAIVGAGNGASIWSVLQRLPAETQAYLPAFIAARYAIVFGDVVDIPMRSAPAPPAYRVKVGHGATVEEVAKAAGLTVEEFRKMNPHILSGTLPSDGCYLNLGAEALKRLKEADL